MVSSADLNLAVRGKVDTALGVGVSFPFHFTSAGGVAKTGGVEHVREAIVQTIGTDYSKRVMTRQFGSNLKARVFSTTPDDMRRRIINDTLSVLKRWERRIRVSSIRVRQDINEVEKIYVEVSYIVLRTNQTGSLVYPFYLTGGDTA